MNIPNLMWLTFQWQGQKKMLSTNKLYMLEGAKLYKKRKCTGEKKGLNELYLQTVQVPFRRL